MNDRHYKYGSDFKRLYEYNHDRYESIEHGYLQKDF
jgi:hypothetical protein